LRSLAEEADLPDPESFAHTWHILMKGSIVAAAEGAGRQHGGPSRLAASPHQYH